MIFDFILGAGELALLAGLCWLAWRLRREQAVRAAEVAALHERQAIIDENRLKVALLDRRLAVIAPLEDIRSVLGRGCRPDTRICTAASRALSEARLLFPGSLAGEIAEVETVLRGYERNLAWQYEAVGAGRHDEQVVLAEAEIAIEQAVKQKLESLAAKLAENTRIED